MIALLGAEKQAAVSIAIAYPECRFAFVSDKKVIDGWDLDNVEMHHSEPQKFSPKADDFRSSIVLCPRWITPQNDCLKNNLPSFHLTEVLSFLSKHFNNVLTVSPMPYPNKKNILKGNFWHRPDTIEVNTQFSQLNINDPYGCGMVYQLFQDNIMTFNVMGRRLPNGGVTLGVFQIYKKSLGRDDCLLAAESVANAQLIDMSIDMLTSMNHIGFFTFNWLYNSAYYLSSIRPIPEAVFQTFLKARMDLLHYSNSGVTVLAPGYKIMSEICYNNYQELV